MQWWMRPGPRRAWAIMKPSPSAGDQVGGGDADVLEEDFGVALVVVVAEHRQRAQHLHPGVSSGTRIMALLGVARAVECASCPSRS